MRGAGFSGGRQCEATRTNFGAGAAIDHALHQIRHEKCELRVDDFDRLVFRRSDTGTTGPLNTANHMRIDMFPLVCESRIRSGQFNGCNFEGAERERRISLDAVVQTHSLRKPGDAAVADSLGHLHGGRIQRFLKRGAQRDQTRESTFEIVRLVYFGSIHKGPRRVEDAGHRRNQAVLNRWRRDVRSETGLAGRLHLP